MPHKCHKLSSKQAWSFLQFRFQLLSLKWSEGSEKHWIMGKSGLSFQICMFTRSSHLLRVRDTLPSLDHPPTVKETKKDHLRFYPNDFVQASTRFYYGNTECSPWGGCHLLLQYCCKTLISSAQKLSGSPYDKMQIRAHGSLPLPLSYWTKSDKRANNLWFCLLLNILSLTEHVTYYEHFAGSRVQQHINKLRDY